MHTARVLHVVAAGEIGGAERMLLDLASRAAEGSGSAAARVNEMRPHSIALFTPNDRLRSLFLDAGIETDDRGGSVREGPLPFLASTLGKSDVRWLANIITKRNAKIVHLHTFASQVLGTRAALLANARVVRTEHSTRVYDDASCWPFSKWSIARTDAIVCISEHVRRRALSRVTPRIAERISVVHNGVDTKHFSGGLGSQTRDPLAARFVALGRLDARKGLELALEAVARVSRAELDVVGDGDERAKLEDLTRRLGIGDRVRFHGFTEDVRDKIRESDFALSTAREEGLGIALLEAMAMERPVVGVPVGGIVEIVREGETGWMSDARTVDAVVRAMTRAIDADVTERKRRGTQARERVTTSFSIDAMRRGYEQVYARLTS